ncbi:MAG: MBL fold metallo-hydrolase, partial [Thaumarchaeota archaeon]|nr:MBL fold metallo-hydrolase [Nitrososphaerota archaeon]
WALRYRPSGFDAAFPLSGHADFSGLVRYAEESGAKQIYLVHGFADELAKHLRRRGLRAEALSRAP